MRVHLVKGHGNGSRMDVLTLEIPFFTTWSLNSLITTASTHLALTVVHTTNVDCFLKEQTLGVFTPFLVHLMFH